MFGTFTPSLEVIRSNLSQNQRINDFLTNKAVLSSNPGLLLVSELLGTCTWVTVF